MAKPAAPRPETALAATSMLHGLAVTRPAHWIDQSIYQFAADSSAPAATLRVGPTGPRLRPNVLLRRLPRPTADGPLTTDLIFGGPNQEQRRQNPSFRIKAAGACEVQGRPGYWQEVSFSPPGQSALLFQYQLAVLHPEGDLVLVLATSDLPEPETLLGALGLAPAL